MGKIATSLSDHVWITSDNPRTENPDSIIGEILAGIPERKNFTVEILDLSEGEAGDVAVIGRRLDERAHCVA